MGTTLRIDNDGKINIVYEQLCRLVPCLEFSCKESPFLPLSSVAAIVLLEGRREYAEGIIEL